MQKNKYKCFSDPKPVVRSVQVDPCAGLKSYFIVNVQCLGGIFCSDPVPGSITCNAGKHCRNEMGPGGLYVKNIECCFSVSLLIQWKPNNKIKSNDHLVENCHSDFIYH